MGVPPRAGTLASEAAFACSVQASEKDKAYRRHEHLFGKPQRRTRQCMLRLMSPMLHKCLCALHLPVWLWRHPTLLPPARGPSRPRQSQSPPYHAERVRSAFIFQIWLAIILLRGRHCGTERSNQNSSEYPVATRSASQPATSNTAWKTDYQDRMYNKALVTLLVYQVLTQTMLKWLQHNRQPGVMYGIDGTVIPEAPEF
jgi:hypothetical protein